MQHRGVPQLVDWRLGLGYTLGCVNTGDKKMTLVASAPAGGDCIPVGANGTVDADPANCQLDHNSSHSGRRA